MAQDTCRDGAILLDRHTGSIRDLGSCLWYLEDPDQALTIAQLQALDSGAFTRHDAGVLNFGYTESAYWTRFDLNTDALRGETDWILELALPLVDSVQLFLVRDGDRKSTRLNSSHVRISYAVFCLKKKKIENRVV